MNLHRGHSLESQIMEHLIDLTQAVAQMRLNH
jgi:hypothetical protein